MPLEIKDGAAAQKYLKTASGAGTSGDPYVPENVCSSGNAYQAGSWSFSFAGNQTIAVTGVLQANLKEVGGTAVDTNSGNKSAGTQRVVIATDQPAVPVTQSLGWTTAITGVAQINSVQIPAVGQAAMAASLPVAIASDQSAVPVSLASIAVTGVAQHNLKEVGGTAVDTNSGNKSAGTQRVVLATDQPAVPVTQSLGWTTAVTGVAQINSAQIPALGQAAMAASLPVTLASDQSAVPVSLSTIAVTGVAQLNLKEVGGTAVDTNSGNKSAGTQRVVIATDQPAIPVSQNGGWTIAITGIGLVDTELPAAAALADSGSNPTTPTVGVALLAWNGLAWDRCRVPTAIADINSINTGSIATVWTPLSGKKIRLMGGTISSSVAASLLFEDNGTGNFVYRSPKLLADTPYNFDLGNGKLLATADNLLKVTASASGVITGSLYGTLE